MSKKKLRGKITSPTGKIHEMDSIEEAVRFIVIVSDFLSKDDYEEIVKTFNDDPTKTYTWEGWEVCVDLSTKRKGIGVTVVETATGKVANFDSIKECAGHMRMKEQKVRSLINSFRGEYNGYRFTKKDTFY